LSLSEKLQIELPWPRPKDFVPQDQHIPILIWGAGSSVGGYAVQILKHWGYRNVLVTASPKHKKHLEELGATRVFDYRSADAVGSIAETLRSGISPQPIRVFDSVDSKFGSLLPISKLAIQPGSKVATVLPVVVSAASSPAGLQLSADPSSEADWAQGVEVHAIVSYAYEAVSVP
jgi:NADPH:quinone reductase-like Zn-dependent oxidoreductase